MIYWLNDWLIDGPTNHQSFLSTPPLYHPPPLITPSYHPLLPPPLTTPSYHPHLPPPLITHPLLSLTLSTPSLITHPLFTTTSYHPLLSPTPFYHSPTLTTTPYHPLLSPPLITLRCHYSLQVLAVYPCRHMCLCASCAEVLPSQGITLP